MYKQASKMKLRFESEKGSLTVEDLWDLPLTSEKGVSLDGLAKKVYHELTSYEINFVDKVDIGKRISELKLNIIKDIIAEKISDREKAKERSLLKSRKEKILEIIEEKESEFLKEKDIDQLKGMLNNM